MRSWNLILCGIIFLLTVNYHHVEAKKKNVLDLDANNWKDMLKGEWMVEFFAPDCPACNAMITAWDRFANYANDHGVLVARIDISKSPGLGGRFYIDSLPKIYHVKDGNFRIYNGMRDNESFSKFIKLSLWEKIKPLAFWRKPNAFPMSIVSAFFNVSHSLKSFHFTIQSNYGIPAWCAYMLIGSGTLVVGGIVGLALIIALDYVYPSKNSHNTVQLEEPEVASYMFDATVPTSINTVLKDSNTSSPVLNDSRIRFRVKNKDGCPPPYEKTGEDSPSISHLEDEDTASSNKKYDYDEKKFLDTTKAFLDNQEIRKKRIIKTQPTTFSKKATH